jgi:hypothetical protein
MKVYIVNGVDGDWDDRVDYPIKCFSDRQIAEKFIEYLKEHNVEMEKHRDYMLSIINKLDENLPVRITPQTFFYVDSFENFKYNLEFYCCGELNKFSLEMWEKLFNYYVKNGNTNKAPNTRYYITDFQVENNF